MFRVSRSLKSNSMSSSKKARERKATKLLSKKRRRNPEETRRLKPLQEKLQKEGLLSGKKLLTNPEGEVSMSEVIEEFMQPWRSMAQNLNEFKNLLGLVVLAWNASFLDAGKQEEMIAQLVQSQGILQEGQEVFGKTFRDMIARKQEHFVDNQRKIVEFDVKETGDEFYFSVASTLE